MRAPCSSRRGTSSNEPSTAHTHTRTYICDTHTHRPKNAYARMHAVMQIRACAMSCMRVLMHTVMRTFMHMRASVQPCVCHVCVRVLTHACTHSCMLACVPALSQTHTCMHIIDSRMRACTCSCMHALSHAHGEARMLVGGLCICVCVCVTLCVSD